jgi:hypothetical protein
MINPYFRRHGATSANGVNGRFQEENRQALCQTAPIIKWVRRIERIADLQERRGSKSYQALQIYQTRGGIPE